AGGRVLDLHLSDPARGDPEPGLPQPAARGAAGGGGDRPARRRPAGGALRPARAEAAAARRGRGPASPGPRPGGARRLRGRSAGLRLRSDAARQPRRAAGRGRGVAARRRAGGRVHSGTRRADGAGHALRGLPGAGPARHEHDGHRHVGHRLLARDGPPGQPAETPRGVSGAAKPHPRRAAPLAPDLPRPGSGGAAALRLAGARRPGARLAPVAPGPVALRRRGLQRPRAAGGGAAPHRRGRQRPHEPGHGADVDLLRDLLLDRTVPARDAAVRAGPAPDRAQQRAARGDARRRGPRAAPARAGAAGGVGRDQLRRGAEDLPVAVGLAEVQQRASGAGFTPAERAGVQGGAPLAPPCSMMNGAWLAAAMTATMAASASAQTAANSVHDAFPRVAVVQVRYTNAGTSAVAVDRWTANRHTIASGDASRRPAFWSYQSGSYESRPDWVLPLRKGFTQDNYQGMNASDYGGGTPVVDVWRPDVGIAVGHLETSPRLVSLPVTMPTASEATVAVRASGHWTLAPGHSLETPRTFVAVHRGDHFAALVDYRSMMQRQGITIAKAPPSAFEPIWCAWGYGRDFTVDQVIGTLPVAKRLGFRWATLDDGWQVAEGDWTPVAKKFPRGDADMKALVDRIHEAGFKAQLWWTPLAVDPGSATDRAHHDWLLLG